MSDAHFTLQAGAETFKHCTIEIPVDDEENGHSNGDEEN